MGNVFTSISKNQGPNLHFEPSNIKVIAEEDVIISIS